MTAVIPAVIVCIFVAVSSLSFHSVGFPSRVRRKKRHSLRAFVRTAKCIQIFTAIAAVIFVWRNENKVGSEWKNCNHLCHALIAQQKQQRAIRRKEERKQTQSDRIVNRNHSLDEMSEEKSYNFAEAKWTLTDTDTRALIFAFCWLITDVYDKYAPFFSRSYFIEPLIAWEDEIKIELKLKMRDKTHRT